MTVARASDPQALIAAICRDLEGAEGLLAERPLCAAGLLRAAAEDICRLTPLMRQLRPWCSMAFMFDRLRFNLKVSAAHAEIATDVAAAYAKGCRYELGKLAEELMRNAEEVRR